MTQRLSIALCQINPTVGDVPGNVARIRAARAEAAAQGAELAVFPELCIAGYPPEDLVLKQAFLDACETAVNQLAADTADGGPAMLIGAPWRIDGRRHNAVLLLDGGKVVAVRTKRHLPNYGVFDEARVFSPGPLPTPVDFRGVRLGLPICEDMWFADVTEALALAGAELLVVINGSPFELEKIDMRRRHAGARVDETRLPLIYVNQICGQDELVFDGASFVLDAEGTEVLRLPAWRPAVVTSHWVRGSVGWSCTAQPLGAAEDKLSQIYQAMVLGLRDYVGKNRFPGVILGLSGGIDSAISAAVAVDALGADKVRCVMMPSPYTSRDSLEDAESCAKLLGVRYDTISIEPAMQAYGLMTAPLFAGTNSDITEENLQSRARGVLLMALSNKFGPMVLTTGNKSEMSTGYATLYGDMCGGYSVLKDVYKTTVFALSRWRNEHHPEGGLGPRGLVMPERVITKPPSAELRPDQKDEDSLPPYEVLDGILKCLIEDELSIEDAAAKGYDPSTVRRVWLMLDRAEYKRRQAPPGVKITSRAFGRDRRYPITNGFTATL